MFGIFSLIALLAGVQAAHPNGLFSGQVTSVQSYINMVDTTLSFGNSTGQFEVSSIIGEGSIDATGGIIASTGNALFVQSVDYYPISAAPGDETHFQYVLNFQSTLVNGTVDSPLGSNSDPIYGCMLAGPFNDGQAFLFILTNTKVYALIAGEGLFAIPIADRIATDYNTYTVVVKRSQQKVLFRINNVDKLEVPGTCGIDPKFALVTSKAEDACIPTYTLDNFIASAHQYFWVGPFWWVYSNGFCQGATFDMCLENASWANRCNCVYNTLGGTAFFGYTAQISNIEIFTVGTTNRCSIDESSSSTYHNWWSRPVKAEA